jgi:hypothetical protein
MIRTDKQKLVKGLIDDLEEQKRNIIQKVSFLKYSDSITRYNTKKELSAKADKLLSVVLIISELDKSFDKKKNLDFIASIKKDFITELKNLKFYVVGDKKSAKFIDLIKNYLAVHGLNVINSNKDAVLIKIKTTDNIGKNDFIRIAVLTLHVNVFDKSRLIGGKSIIIKERYNGSYESVYKNASIHLEQDIKSQGLKEVIGINLNID